jgi:hypothetical protein
VCLCVCVCVGVCECACVLVRVCVLECVGVRTRERLVALSLAALMYEFYKFSAKKRNTVDELTARIRVPMYCIIQ